MEGDFKNDIDEGKKNVDGRNEADEIEEEKGAGFGLIENDDDRLVKI